MNTAAATRGHRTAGAIFHFIQYRPLSFERDPSFPERVDGVDMEAVSDGELLNVPSG